MDGVGKSRPRAGAPLEADSDENELDMQSMWSTVGRRIPGSLATAYKPCIQHQVGLGWPDG